MIACTATFSYPLLHYVARTCIVDVCLPGTYTAIPSLVRTGTPPYPSPHLLWCVVWFPIRLPPHIRSHLVALWWPGRCNPCRNDKRQGNRQSVFLGHRYTTAPPPLTHSPIEGCCMPRQQPPLTRLHNGLMGVLWQGATYTRRITGRPTQRSPCYTSPSPAPCPWPSPTSAYVSVRGFRPWISSDHRLPTLSDAAPFEHSHER